MVATFLPWVSVSVLGVSVSAKGSDGDGWLSFAFFAVVLGLAIYGMFREAKWQKIVVTIAAAIALIIVSISLIDSLNNGLNIGIGIILGVFTGLVGVITPWLPIDKNSN